MLSFDAYLVAHAVLAVLLAGTTVCDLRKRRIPNALVVVIASTGAAASVITAAPALGSSLLAAVVVFLVAAVAWKLRLCGGGDAKLATAVALWVGTSQLVDFLVATAVMGGMLALAQMGALTAKLWLGTRRSTAVESGNPSVPGGATVPHSGLPALPSLLTVKVPYGVAIAGGALFTVLRVSL